MTNKFVILAWAVLFCLGSIAVHAEPDSPVEIPNLKMTEEPQLHMQSIPSLEAQALEAQGLNSSEGHPAPLPMWSPDTPRPMPPAPNYEFTLPWPTSYGTFSITTNSYVENTAQVIAPQTNKTCPLGRTILSAGTPTRLFYRDLYNESGWYDETATTKTASLPVGSHQDLYNRTDNILIKLKDGSLMLIRMVLTWEPVTKKPAWWDNVTDIIDPDPNHYKVFPKGTRAQFASCGVQWIAAKHGRRQVLSTPSTMRMDAMPGLKSGTGWSLVQMVEVPGAGKALGRWL